MNAPGLDSIVGYHHGGVSADIDPDGDLDVFVTENFRGAFFLVNDGTGNFIRDTTRVHLQGAVFTAELVDVDILAGGIESDGFPTQVLWGDGSGVFSTLRTSLLPAIRGYGWSSISMWRTPMAMATRTSS